MGASFGLIVRTGRGKTLRGWQFLAIIPFALVLPAITFYCWHPGSLTTRVLLSEDCYSQVASEKTSSPWEVNSIQQFLNPPYSRRLDETVGSASRNWLRIANTRALIAAQNDPFMLALAAGQSEGVLVVRRFNGKVPILGPSRSRGSAIAAADFEILQAIRTGAGGSFRNFYSTVFGNASHESALAFDSANMHEENPFTKAATALAETAASEKTESVAVDQKDAGAPKEEKPSSSGKDDQTNASNIGAGGAGGNRPHLLMNLGDRGSFHLTAASQLREGTFESAELGVREFSMLPFSDAAEFPISIAVGDLNGDGVSDVVFHIAPQGLLRFYYGSPDGTYEEGLQIEVGRRTKSIAAADFNGDGLMDLAVSDVGSGGVTFLFADGQYGYRYKTLWSEAYRDYITAADTKGTGLPDLLGMTYSNQAFVLANPGKSGSSVAGLSFDYTPSLNSAIFTSDGHPTRVNAVVMGSNLTVNIDNRMNQLTSILNVVSGSGVYVVVGDLGNNGRMCIGLAIPRHNP